MSFNCHTFGTVLIRKYIQPMQFIPWDIHKIGFVRASLPTIEKWHSMMFPSFWQYNYHRINCHIIEWMDGWLSSFSISVISEWWADDNKRLCAVEPHLQSRRFCSKAGLELRTAGSVGQYLTHCRVSGAPRNYWCYPIRCHILFIYALEWCRILFEKALELLFIPRAA